MDLFIIDDEGQGDDKVDVCMERTFINSELKDNDDDDDDADEGDDDDDDSDCDLQPRNLKYHNINIQNTKLNPKKDFDIHEFKVDMGWTAKNKKFPKTTKKQIAIANDALCDDDELQKVLDKSVLKPGLEKKESLPSIDEVGKNRKRKLRRKENEKTKGKNWFNLPKTELTPEIKHDLQVIRMRSVLDPKHFYKKNDVRKLPKYFHIGKVVDSPVDYYSKLTKKERKKTIVDELIADADFVKYSKNKYKEIIDKNNKKRSKAHKHAKKLKKKSK